MTKNKYELYFFVTKYVPADEVRNNVVVVCKCNNAFKCIVRDYHKYKAIHTLLRAPLPDAEWQILHTSKTHHAPAPCRDVFSILIDVCTCKQY
jgi:hypothetical protein